MTPYARRSALVSTPLALALACGPEPGGETEGSTSGVGATTAAGSTGSTSAGAAATGTSGESSGVDSEGPALVDLAVVALSWSPPGPRVGDAVIVTATIANEGGAPLNGPVAVAFAVDGAPLVGLTAQVGPLAAGATAEVQSAMSWKPDDPGDRTITATVDPDGALDDPDPSDQSRSAVITVAAAAECRTIAAWGASAPFADDAHVSHPLPSFAHEGWLYVHTKAKDGADDRRLLAAKPGADGALGPWQEASADHGGGPHGFTAVVAGGQAYHFRNGHIARFELVDGMMQGDVTLLEDDPNTAFGGNKYVWDSAVYARLGAGSAYLIHLGGFSFTGYQYRPDVYRSGVPLAAAFTDVGLDHPAQRPGKAAFWGPASASHGFIFTGEGDGARLWRSRIDVDGGLEPWTQLGDLPAGTGNQRGDLFIAGRTLFAVRGAAVHRADVGAAGELAPWVAAASLPEDQVDVSWGEGHAEGAAYGIIGDYVYLAGPKRAFYARLEPAECAE